jgi:hypothetical protein
MLVNIFGFYPAPKLVEFYQNASSFAISVMGFVTLKWFPTFLPTLCKVIFTQLSVDMLFAKGEFYIHHALGLSALIPYFAYNMNDDASVYLLHQGLAVEYSTIFYTFGYFVDNFAPKTCITSTVSNVSNIMFISLFFKYRIFDYFHNIIINPAGYSWYTQYDISYIPLIGKYASMGGMFCLNLYWFSIILKKIYKAVCSRINRFEYSEYILQYTMFANLYIAYSVYSPHINTIFHHYYLDIAGITLISATSYYYHRSNYESLLSEGDQFDCVAMKRLDPFINDMMSIHARVFLSILTNMIASSRITIWIFASFLYNTLAAFNIKYMLSSMCLHKNRFVYGEIHHLHNRRLSIIGGVPIVIDTLYLIYNSNDLYYAACNLTILYLIILVTFIKPFYKMNHTLVHLLLMVQTYYISNTNIHIENKHSLDKMIVFEVYPFSNSCPNDSRIYGVHSGNYH